MPEPDSSGVQHKMLLAQKRSEARSLLAAVAQETTAVASPHQRLLHGTFWSVAGTVVAQGLTFVSSVLVARLLGREAFGQLNIVTGMIGTLGTFAGLGLGMTATKYVAEFRHTDKERAGAVASALLRMAWLSGWIFTLVLLLGSGWIARDILRSAVLTIPVILSAPLIVLNTVNGLQSSLLQGMEKFRLGAFFYVTRSGLIALAVVWACLIWGLEGVIGTTVSATAITTLLYAVMMRRECASLGIHLRPGRILEERAILFNYSLPALLATVVVGPANWAASAIIARQPGGFGELGLLTAANHWRQMALLIPQTLTGVLMPLLSAESAKSGEGDTFSSLLERSHWISTLIVFPVTTVAMFASGWLIKLYGKGFAGGDRLIIITCGTAMIMAIGTAFGAAVQAKARMWLGFGINSSYGFVLLAATIPFAGRFGGEALAWATFVAYVLTSVWSWIAMKKMVSTGIGPRLYGALAYAVAMTFACYYCPSAYRIWLTPVAGAASLAVVLTALLPADLKEFLHDQLAKRGLSALRLR